MSTNGDSASSSYNTIKTPSQHEHLYQFVENGGKLGRKRAYICSNGKILKTTYENATSNITFFFKDLFKQIFLPVGFPDSVSNDYVSYQVWDTVQAFCSTITGTFTTQSILKSIGVGDESATALGAAITWIIKDGSGMGGRIIFAWWKGNSLDANCKFWRMFADILNDVALVIEFTLPWWGLKSNMYPLCLTSTMKSIVGVAGGATRAAITQHQAIRDNMGDVTAKDGSQETCVNLIASILGIFVLTSFETSEFSLSAIFVFLTFLHIYANYKAVQSLIFKHLNLSRFLIVFNSFLQYDAVANPVSANKTEAVGLRFSKHKTKNLCGFDIKMGNSLQTPFKTLHEEKFNLVMKAFKGLRYIIIPDVQHRVLYVAFDHKIDSEIVIRAHFHAIMLGMALSQYNNVILNIRAKRQLHHVAPMQRLSNLLKKMPRPLPTQQLEIFTLNNFVTFNEFINGEALSFFTALTVNHWDLSRNSLVVGEWRCNLIEEDPTDSGTSKREN